MDLLFNIYTEYGETIELRVSGTTQKLDEALKEMDALVEDMAKTRLSLWPDERASDPQTDAILEVYRGH